MPSSRPAPRATHPGNAAPRATLNLRSPRLLHALAVLLPALLTTFPTQADQWNQFRGPHGSGVAADCRPPVKPDSASEAWRAPVPPGLSAPVLSDERIFLTGLVGDTLVTLAYSKATGEELWRADAPAGELEKVHKANHPAASTPLVDEDQLYVYFGSFGLLCYDHDGNRRWKRAIPPPRSLYGMTTSPISHRDTVILVIDDDENLPESRMSRSKVVAFDKQTGEPRWETARPLVRSGWSTPTVWNHDQGPDLVILGSGRVDAYDPATGREKWFAPGFSRETIAIPVVDDDHVYVSSAQLGGGSDDVLDPEPFWRAMLSFDQDQDGRIGTDEITRDFTWPLRPEYPVGHPGFGFPLPDDEARRKERQLGIFGWVDKDKDGFWTKEELSNHMSTRRGKPRLLAIRPGGTGDITETHVDWELNRGIPEIPSPLVLDSRIYLARNGGILTAVDATSGKSLYRGRLGGTGGYSASPVGANGHLYLLSDEGVISVVKAGDSFELVHTHLLEEPATVTPAIDQDSLYLRSRSHLRAFRNPAN